ncbi:MAG TPA: thiamine pyrophosphate-binding protein [Candidatus Dormibacteraeota bacterium]|nr:thiamine pyrophosphate-binding protein [Candidatus Dormibacteraeota bacterium]
MADITGGELLARCLANEGIRFVFGLPCPEVDPLLAALEGNGMRLVPVRHEAAAVHMAEGLYKTTGQVAAVLGNPGPGSANLIPGVITARHEGVPVVAITAQHRLGLVYPSPPSTFQGQDQLDVFRSAVKWGGPIFEWNRIREVVALAFREMWCGRPGPVQLEVPAPVLYALGEEADVRILPPSSYRVPPPRASAEQIREAAALLAAAKRPLVFVGSGVDRAGANAAVAEIVDILGCPVITTMAGRSVLPTDHPRRLQGYGPGADLARREADVVCVLGSRLGNLDLPFDKYWGDGSKQTLIHIDIDPRNIGVTRPLTLGIVADLASATRELADALRGAGAKPRGAQEVARYLEAQEQWQAAQFAAVASWAGPRIHPAHAMLAIGEVFGRDAVYVTDGGNTALWAYGGLPTTRPRSYHSILELGMLGTGIPSAIGAKLGAPERDVVCVTGDGAAGFNFMEMQSAAREGVKITTIVFAEGSWTMEEPNERLLYGRTFGTAMGTVRWDRVGEGLGCSAWYVDRIEDLMPALVQAKACEGPAVVCVKSDRDANLQIPTDMFARFFEVYRGPVP